MSQRLDTLTAMHTIYFWQHTNPVTGRRTRTRWRMTEADALQRLTEPERIEGSGHVVVPAMVTPAGHWASGLVRREDDAMVPVPSPAD